MYKFVFNPEAFEHHRATMNHYFATGEISFQGLVIEANRLMKFATKHSVSVQADTLKKIDQTKDKRHVRH